MKFWKILTLISILQTNAVFGTLKTLDRMVALVNHHIILDSDIRNNIYMFHNNIYNVNNDISQNIIYYQQILNQLITDHLILQVATQQNINIEYNKLDQMINCIAHLYGMTLDQFRLHLHNIGLNYEKYYSQQYRELLKKSICDSVLYYRSNILMHEIKKTSKESNTVNVNKQFKLRHITFSLPIQPAQSQIDRTKDFARLLIKKKASNNNIKELMNTYFNKEIIQIIKVQETEWISWKDIPMILDKHLQKAKKNDIIGPVVSYDGIHIIEVQDMRYKQTIFPITKIKAKIFTIKNSHKNANIIEQLLQTKEHIEKSNTTDDMITKKSQDIHINQYEENIIYQDLDDFDPSIRRVLASLKRNEISIPVYTSNGWRLIQLIDISILDYNEIMYERTYLYLLNKKFDEIMKNWIQELRSASYIKIIK
ncbi:peptidylprolyl isomerase [Blochmannia endosymbiont of Camponotus nipponensis]|uniref:peptidylprolyl isomerase n=1 Tax=Blochmannia endosymbiont of Camponotus nipponensis TaxID=2681986 RepID=UPI001356E712|nr:peptidylprolyl isomerase [Blochmannia endosymbiont of Camponotus nipponensis]